MTPPPLKTDGKGNIITNPIVGWAMHRIAGTAVLLAVQYLDAPGNEPTTAFAESIQFVLTPQQSRELADSLTKAANGILSEPLPPGATLQ
jgi:hypothetical protein